MTGTTRTARERMVYSTVQLVRTRGVAATGVRDVIDHAGAPRGSFQHYFPGGKDQLVTEAVTWAGDFAARSVSTYRQTARKPTPAGLFAHLVQPWQDEFARRGFERGCPLMATAADLAADDSAVTAPLDAALQTWEEAVIGELVAMQVPRRRARTLATLMLSALEGAIMLARVRRDATPLTSVVTALKPLLAAEPTG